MTLNLQHWAEWRGLMVGVAAKKLGNRHQADAEDVVQETAMKMISTHTKRTMDRSYMLTSVKHTAINFNRHYHGKKHGEDHEVPDEHGYLEGMSFEEDPLANLAAEEARSQVASLLSQLSAHQRIAVESFHLNGKSYKQIGEENHWSPEKVRKEMFCAMDRMRHILGCPEPSQRGHADQ